LNLLPHNRKVKAAVVVTDLTLPVMFTLIHERSVASFTGGSFLTYPVKMGNHFNSKEAIYLHVRV